MEKDLVVIDRRTGDVLSASNAFYTFIGQRLYHTFEQLIHPDDRAAFAEALAACTGERFSLRLLSSEGEPVLYLASVAPDVRSNAACTTLFPADRLLAALEKQTLDIAIRNRILGAYGDEYFAYNAAADQLRFFSAGRTEQEIITVPLENFLTRLIQHIPENQYDAVMQFCADIRAHKPTFSLVADGNPLDFYKEATVTLIRGVSIVENGEYLGAAGYVHYGSLHGTDNKPGIEHDPLTGVLSKQEITARAMQLIDVQRVQDTSLCIVDVDNFKQVNDSFGHLTGDVVLQQVARIIEDEVGANGMVGRIGGDEFFVIFRNMGNMEYNREQLRSIKNRVAAAFPPGDNTRPTVTLSIGCASFSKDGGRYEDLFQLADFAMYRAKRNGRNRYVIFDAAKHGTLAEIRQMNLAGERLDDRGDLSVGDLVCTMLSRAFSGDPLPIQRVLLETCRHLNVQRMILYAGTPRRVVAMAGEDCPSAELLAETAAYLDDPAFLTLYDGNDAMVCNDTRRFAQRSPALFESLHRLGVQSCIHLRGQDVDGIPFVLSIQSISSRVTWNATNAKYYPLYQRMLHEYRLGETL